MFLWIFLAEKHEFWYLRDKCLKHGHNFNETVFDTLNNHMSIVFTILAKS